MSNYYLNINGKIELDDFGSINDYLELVGENDKINISLYSKYIEDYNLLCKILKTKNFDFICEDEHDDKTHFINAYKNNYKNN